MLQMLNPVILVFVLTLFLTKASTWTLNYPEVEKYSLERAKAKPVNVLNKINVDNEVADARYAKEFEYQAYRDKKINGIFISGSKYLDGLSQALSDYKDIMDKCTQIQQTTNRPILKFLERRPSVEDPCAEVMKNGEYIQRLSEVVMWTTSAMRDKSDQKYTEEDETALIARLAWLLDRLAFLTGFESTKNTTDTAATENPQETASNDSPLEIMEPIENGRPLSKLPPKLRNKRSTKPFDEFANYYLKYKAWTNSNPEKELIKPNTQFDVENNIKMKIQKRSVKSKKAVDIKVIDNKKTVVLKPEFAKAKLILHKIVDIGFKVKDKIVHVKKALKHHE